eukprot:8446668-Alexandrium_andersonii.AAC.1
MVLTRVRCHKIAHANCEVAIQRNASFSIAPSERWTHSPEGETRSLETSVLKGPRLRGLGASRLGG